MEDLSGSSCRPMKLNAMVSRMCVYLMLVLVFAVLCCVGTVIVVFGAYSLLNIHNTKEETLYGPKGTCLVVIAVGTFVVMLSGICLLCLKLRMKIMIQQYNSLIPNRHMSCEVDRDVVYGGVFANYQLRNITLPGSESPPPSYKSLAPAYTETMVASPPPYSAVVSEMNNPAILVETSVVPVHNSGRPTYNSASQLQHCNIDIDISQNCRLSGSQAVKKLERNTNASDVHSASGNISSSLRRNSNDTNVNSAPDNVSPITKKCDSSGTKHEVNKFSDSVTFV